MKKSLIILFVLIASVLSFKTFANDEYLDISETVTGLSVGETATVVAKLNLIGVNNGDITFFSSDEDVFTVNQNGVITAIGVGIARLTASFDEKNSSLIITVYNSKPFYDSFESGKNSEHGTLSTTFARTGNNSELWSKDLNSVYLNQNALNMLSSNTANFLIGEIWLCDAPELAAKFPRANLRFTDWAGNNVNVLYEQGTRNIVFPASNVTGATITVPQRSGWRQFIVDTSTAGKIDIYMDGILYFSATGKGSNNANYNNFRRFAYTDSWGDSTSINVYVDDVSLYSLGKSALIKAESITLDETFAELFEGLDLTLSAVINPINSTESIIWLSSNELVATVTPQGLVEAVGTGYATITARAGSANAHCDIQVVAPEFPVTSVSFNEKSVTVFQGETKELFYNIRPENASNKKVVFSSDNQNTVTVNENGVISAVKTGTATVTVRTRDGGFTDICSVTVVVDTQQLEDAIEEAVQKYSSLVAGTQNGQLPENKKQELLTEINSAKSMLNLAGIIQGEIDAKVSSLEAKVQSTVNSVIGITVSSPVLSDVAIGGAQSENESLSISYVFTSNSTGTDATEFVIYISQSNEDGSWQEVFAGTAVTSGSIQFPINANFNNKYIRARIIPLDTNGNYGIQYMTPVMPGPFAPEITKESMSGSFSVGGTITVAYEFTDRNNDAEGISIFQWLISDTLDGEYVPLEGKTTTSLYITDEIYNKFVKLMITPVSQHPPYNGRDYIGRVYCRPFKPVAQNVEIKGERKVGKTITGEYDYIDYNLEEEEGSVYRWLRSDSENGVYSVISGADKKTYTLTNADIDKYLKFEVTPKKAALTGDTVISSEFKSHFTPSAYDVRITGTAKSGSLLIGNYRYDHPTDAEKNSIYRWYSDGRVIGEEISYMVKTSDEGKTIYFEVCPVSEDIPDYYRSFKSSDLRISSSGSGGGGSGDYSFSKGSAGLSVVPIADDNFKAEPERIYSFNDISQHWACDDIELIAELGIIQGVGDKSFSPEGLVTRAEFSAMIIRMLDLSVQNYEFLFNDVAEDDWYSGYVQTVFAHKIAQGSFGSFRPNESITREEAAKIIARVGEIISLGSDEDEEEPSFSDDDEISDWAKEYVKYAYKYGIVKGYEDGSFMPKNNMTRAETAVIMKRILEVKK